MSLSVAVPQLLLLLSIVQGLHGASIEHGVWDYESNGPATWPAKFAQFCSGRKQSPVDLRMASSIHDPLLTEFAMRMDETPEYGLTLENDGHKLQVTLGSDLVIKMGLGDTMYYTAVQLHWHWGSDSSKGSEHTVTGVPYPMEGHLVFWNSFDYANATLAMHKVGGLAVLGVFYEESTNDNPLFSAIERYVPRLNKAGTKVEVKLKANTTNFLEAFLPKSTRHFYRYEGSLTTPDCSENVLWTVYTTTVPISTRQLNILRALRYTSGNAMVNNNRPVQPLNPTGRPGANRMVYRTFDRKGKALGDVGYSAVGAAGKFSGTSALTALAAAAVLGWLHSWIGV